MGEWSSIFTDEDVRREMLEYLRDTKAINDPKIQHIEEFLATFENTKNIDYAQLERLCIDIDSDMTTDQLRRMTTF